MSPDSCTQYLLERADISELTENEWMREKAIMNKAREPYQSPVECPESSEASHANRAGVQTRSCDVTDQSQVPQSPRQASGLLSGRVQWR
jgi:hypothetical protein